VDVESGRVEIGQLVWGDRYAGPGALRQQAAALQNSGVVDYAFVTDQYGNFIPRSLWTPERAPIAAVMPDPDSMTDAVATLAYLLGAATDLGVILSTDSIRRGPVEFASLALTLAELSAGRAQLWVGSGEIKNIRPLGYKRQGLGKLEDCFRVFRRLWEDPAPLDYDGNHWTLRGATVGGQRGHRPQLWGMGEGPRLLDVATSEGDGIASAVPLKFQTAEDCQERIAAARAMVERKGRDPQAFNAGMWVMTLAHPDENIVDRALESPIVKWMTALMGRVGTENWQKAGVESPVPDGWVYYADYITTQASESFVEETLNKVTRSHVEKSWIWGTPAQVADELQPLVDSDLQVLAFANYVTMALEPEAIPSAFAADLELAELVKAPAPTRA
jgi:phthiodiolone/phenolphthiodiolone dimycocerosates ketoreductase